MCGEYPGGMSGVGHFYVFTFLHVSEHSEHICFFYFYDGDRINYFQRVGVTFFIRKNLGKIPN